MPNMTIKDIARLSGCSVSTISRVINDRPDVRSAGRAWAAVLGMALTPFQG